MIYRSKAPLRIGLAGGGTDVSPYCDLYRVASLNATISFYTYTTIETIDEKLISFEAIDKEDCNTFTMTDSLQIDGNLRLVKGAYNRLIKEYGKVPAALNSPPMWMSQQTIG